MINDENNDSSDPDGTTTTSEMKRRRFTTAGAVLVRLKTAVRKKLLTSNLAVFVRNNKFSMKLKKLQRKQLQQLLAAMCLCTFLIVGGMTTQAPQHPAHSTGYHLVGGGGGGSRQNIELTTVVARPAAIKGDIKGISLSTYSILNPKAWLTSKSKKQLAPAVSSTTTTMGRVIAIPSLNPKFWLSKTKAPPAAATPTTWSSNNKSRNLMLTARAGGVVLLAGAVLGQSVVKSVVGDKKSIVGSDNGTTTITPPTTTTTTTTTTTSSPSLPPLDNVVQEDDDDEGQNATDDVRAIKRNGFIIVVDDDDDDEEKEQLHENENQDKNKVTMVIAHQLKKFKEHGLVQVQHGIVQAQRGMQHGREVAASVWHDVNKFGSGVAAVAGKSVVNTIRLKIANSTASTTTTTSVDKHQNEGRAVATTMGILELKKLKEHGIAHAQRGMTQARNLTTHVSRYVNQVGRGLLQDAKKYGGGALAAGVAVVGQSSSVVVQNLRNTTKEVEMPAKLIKLKERGMVQAQRGMNQAQRGIKQAQKMALNVVQYVKKTKKVKWGHQVFKSLS
jgi:hypothetical protein